MENYRLTQTGEEVQGILDNAATEQELTAEVERAQGAEQTLGGAIDDEELRAKAAEEALSGAIGDEELRAKAAEEQNANGIAEINAKIPAGASSENQLADKDYVNSSIETATATFRGSYNLVSDLHLAVDATHAQIATLLGTVISEADNNDYSYVLVPTSAQTPTEIASIEKYTYGANGWAFAYALNNSGFTSAQWAAINSGITSGLVAKLTALPTNADLLLLLAGKQDVLTFDDVPVEGSNNPVKSGGVHSAIDDEKTARVNAVNAVAGRVDTIEGEIPATASSENKLVDQNQMNSSISTATATFRGAFNLVADLGLTVSATHEQIGTALAGEISTADNNDYAFVQVPTSDETPAQILKVERYKFNGTAWVFEYELNNSGFTAAQWAALNSGITSGLVAKLVALPTNDELVLALAGKQDVLTFDNVPTENSNNPVKSSGVYAADKALSDAIEAILLLIPSAATSLNKLVDTDLMNSSISTATATFRGTYNLVSDLSLDLTATHAQIATALAGEIATADNNDYAFVLVPTSVGTPTEIAQTDRYKFNGTSWAYEYTLNTSGFTSAQWAAINSGITAALVASLADIPDLIPSEATTSNQLADKAYVLASILAATPAFKGQFTTLAELQAVASPKDGDLGIVRTKDSDGMDVFTVYQYLNNAWGVFYSLSYHPQTKPATTGTTGDYPYNGMGRVELAKNMVNTGTELAPVMVNQLTQDMFYKGAVGSRVPNTNTIFVIRYDYVLGEDITIPANCVLEFEGGSISGAYTLTGNNTYIISNRTSIFGDSIVLAGTLYNDEIPICWFGGMPDNENIDCTPLIQKAMVFNKPIIFDKGTYYLSELYISNQPTDTFTLIGSKVNDIFNYTNFVPYANGQRYIIKAGGGKDELGGNGRAYNIKIVDIYFNGSVNKDNVTTQLVNRYAGVTTYLTSLLILDNVQAGKIAISGRAYFAPLVTLCYIYEVEIDKIICYRAEGKSDLPVVQVLNDISNDITAVQIHTFMCENCVGPLLTICPNSRILEFVINNMFFEQTIEWTESVPEGACRTFANNEISTISPTDYTLVPTFDIAGFSRLYINNFTVGQTNQLWWNKNDHDGETWDGSTLDRIRALVVFSNSYTYSFSLVFNNIICSSYSNAQYVGGGKNGSFAKLVVNNISGRIIPMDNARVTICNKFIDKQILSLVLNKEYSGRELMNLVLSNTYAGNYYNNGQYRNNKYLCATISEIPIINGNGIKINNDGKYLIVKAILLSGSSGYEGYKKFTAKYYDINNNLLSESNFNSLDVSDFAGLRTYIIPLNVTNADNIQVFCGSGVNTYIYSVCITDEAPLVPYGSSNTRGLVDGVRAIANGVVEITRKGNSWIDNLGHTFASHKGTTSDRPTGLTTDDAGFQYFDETLGKPIYWNGSAWVDANGTPV